jgi:flagellar hook-length control protein FliK
MNQLAAFFAQMTAPATATAGARAQTGTPQGDAFANILAQIQASLLNDGAAVTPAQQIQSTPAAQFLAQLQSTNTTTDDLVAQLKALTGTEGDTSKIDALLALLAPQQATAQPTQSQPGTEATAQATLAGIIASLQQQIQTQAGQTTAPTDATASTTTPTTQPTDALRGTLPIDTAQAAAQQTDAANPANAADARATAQAVENAAIALAVPPAARPKQNAEQPTPPNAVAPTSAKTTSKQQPGDATAQAPVDQAPTKQGKTPTTETGTQSAATPKAHTDQSTSTQTKSSDTTAPQQASAVASAQAAVTQTLNTAQQVTITAATTPAAVPLEALAVHVARKFESGVSQFEISLHPADLGKLDISLSVGDDGHVQAILRAERPETLDLLQRDARSLEQQLRQAGLDVGSNALSFSLSSGNGQRQAPFSGWPAFAQAQDDADGVTKQQAASTYFAVRQQGGVDIRV